MKMDLKTISPRVLYGTAMPTAGYYSQGDRVVNISPTAEKPVGYWLRVTNGSEHVLGVDWIEK